ncbi:MAG: DUF177 domain-containing protein [Bacteroidetes bacterium]|nr:DUF177 domain-containing protein [Bacteroidota bacterium]
MEAHKDYLIQFGGLKEGIHEFAYEIGDAFFESFEQSLVDGASIGVKIIVDKRSDHLQLNFTFKGTLTVSCDRCAVSAPYPVEGDARLILQLSNGDSEDDELVFLGPDAYEYNIAQYLYETLALSLPLRVVHCEATGDKSICDQTVISMLDSMSVPEPGPEDQPETDPRWEALKKLSGNN